MEYDQISLFDDKNPKDEKQKNIISASRRTDLPAFYYQWLQEILKEGSVTLNNPRFLDKTYVVDLHPDKVHSIVLWSKNFEVIRREPGYLENYNLYFQYTINHYARLLEPNVPEYKDTLKTLEGMLKSYKPEQFNIRFDPIIISMDGEIEPNMDKPGNARLLAFEQLCRHIKVLGMEKCRVTTSYLALYGYTKKRLIKSGIDIIYLNEQQQYLFFERMVEIADQFGISLYSCASPLLENVKGMKKGQCIDGKLLQNLFGGKVGKSKDNGQRKACGCTISKDIGTYSKDASNMKCLHKCIYCYATKGDITNEN